MTYRNCFPIASVIFYHVLSSYRIFYPIFDILRVSRVLSPRILIINLTLPVYIHLPTVSEVLPRYYPLSPLTTAFSTFGSLTCPQTRRTSSQKVLLHSRSISCGFHRFFLLTSSHRVFKLLLPHFRHSAHLHLPRRVAFHPTRSLYVQSSFSNGFRRFSLRISDFHSPIACFSPSLRIFETSQ